MKQVNGVGNVFLENGLHKVDNVFVMVPRILEDYVVYLAAIKTGVIIDPSSEMLTTKDLQYRVTHGGINGVVSYHTFSDKFEGINEYDELIKFSIGEEVKDWHYLDELKEKASESLDFSSPSK